MKLNYFTYQIHDKCENIIKQKGILDNQGKSFFKIYWMHSCSFKTQVLSACCRTDWLEKFQQKYVDTTIFL